MGSIQPYASAMPPGTASAVTINITNPQAFSNGAVLPGTIGSGTGSATASGALSNGSGIAGNLSTGGSGGLLTASNPTGVNNPQQLLMDAYNQTQNAINTASSAYNNYLNLGRNLQNQAFQLQHQPQLPLPSDLTPSGPLQQQASQQTPPQPLPASVNQPDQAQQNAQSQPQQNQPLPNSQQAQASPPTPPPVALPSPQPQPPVLQALPAPQQPPTGLVPMPAGFVPPAGMPITYLSALPAGAIPLAPGQTPPPGAMVVDAATGQIVPSPNPFMPQGPSAPPTTLTPMPIGYTPPPGVPVTPLSGVAGPQASFNPGPTPNGPSVGPQSQGQPDSSRLASPVDLHLLGMADLNNHIAHPVSMDDKLSAMEEVTQRPNQANAQTYDLLLKDLSVSTANLTGSELLNVTDSQRAAAMALSVLNANKYPNLPVRSLPGFKLETALIADPGTSPDVKVAILQGLRLLNRPQDPDIRNLGQAAKASNNRQVRSAATILLSGKPLSLDN